MMSENNFFEAGCIDFKPEISTKGVLLSLIARRVDASLGKDSPGAAKIEALFREREDMGTTAFGDNYAFPHCRLPADCGFVTGAVLLDKALDFGNPLNGTDIFIYMAGPAEKRSEHIKLLARISKMVSSKGFLKKAGECRDEDGLGSLLRRSLGKEKPAGGRLGKHALFMVSTGNEDDFNETISLFTGVAEGPVKIIETENGDSYLYKLPLFSAYWTEQTDSFGRLIVAVVPHVRVNEMIRKIRYDIDGSEREIGLAVSELSYFSPEEF